eukprot:CAMPEP_0202700896 /NCGR_PEP_ID=MMETSP1385-20130828/14034_1 /ASSEMBLY_ACC=CAM_ASM_000861 /TAXON_ID=933848 /ORGANISM="Elphidium margaritaceum" /LENGTH=200 /DNA_ID=CAMNT_0049358187 /DNA_START=67 /DNA_END=669 /DNA_ORIENTATION=-
MATQLVLVLGDMHIPTRSIDLPEQFKSLLVPGKIHHVLCTGNVGSKKAMEYLQRIAPNVHTVRGDFDKDSSLPNQKVVQIGNFKMGLIHGHQIVPWGDTEALAAVQRQLDVDILVSGHTHQMHVSTVDGRCLINPGSATGAYSCISSDVSPSFILLTLQGNTSSIYVYRMKKDGELDVSKSSFDKLQSKKDNAKKVNDLE